MEMEMTDAPNPFGFTDGLRDQCRETCAEYGDPPCFMLPELCDPCDHITPCEECLAAAIAELVEGLQRIRAATEEIARAPMTADRWADRIEEECLGLIAKYAVEE